MKKKEKKKENNWTTKKRRRKKARNREKDRPQASKTDRQKPPIKLHVRSFGRKVYSAVMRTKKILFNGITKGIDSWVWFTPLVISSSVGLGLCQAWLSLFLCLHMFTPMPTQRFLYFSIMLAIPWLSFMSLWLLVMFAFIISHHHLHNHRCPRRANGFIMYMWCLFYTMQQSFTWDPETYYSPSSRCFFVILQNSVFLMHNCSTSRRK